MKVVIKRGWSGFRCARLGGIAALSLCLAAGAASAAEIADTQLSAPPTVLPWISEVVKMNDAGVPQEVIANYVKNTSARSTLSADDLIYLHNHNVSTTLMTAMIEHGAAPAQTSAAAAGVPMPTTPAPAYAQYPAYPQAQAPPPSSADYGYGTDQTQPVVNYYYGSSGYNNGYPYYSYGYSYPYYYYPVYYFPFCHGNNNCFHNGFHVHSNGAVHSNSGFHTTTSSFSHASFAMGSSHGMSMGMHH
jgi:hypothetical protein